MFRMCKVSAAVVAIAVVIGMTGKAAQAGFSLSGYTPQVVESETGVPNAAASMQTVRLWGGSGWSSSLNDYMTVNTGFTLPSCQDVNYARLYLEVWGGTSAYTAQVTVIVNGHALAPVSFGGTADTNPTFNTSQSCCVYGVGMGEWQLAFSGISSYLNTNGTANTITIQESDPTGNFDGRIYNATLAAVYQSPSINQSLDFYLAEGDGYMRKPPANPTYGNAPAQRSIAFNGLNTANVTSATYMTLYTLGDAGQKDWQYFNGYQLGSNDVATGQYGQYGPDLTSFDVTNDLATNSTAVYSVNDPSGETSLVAGIGLLEVVHPAPEPTTIGLLALGGVGMIARIRRRR